MDEPQDKALRSVGHVRSALLDAIDADQLIPWRHEPRVHAAIDLLVAARADAPLLRRVEDISCTLHMMNRFLREGRVNAFASARLRLRSAAAQLSGPCQSW
jgi:hypothetical protein